MTYSGTKVEFDILGRVLKQYVPAEISSGWTVTGTDDTVWRYTSNEYDWKSRPLKTYPNDSTGNDGKESLYTYEGCDCAGGQITTVKGPVTTAVDVAGNTQTTKRRTQKAHEDILGRMKERVRPSILTILLVSRGW